ncbi:MAG: MBL fold metallo-hydrolase [Deltaproteobacteria bacterium]|nr:MBL fold metallo-hydrolase [Deltaproteobacteria bacterium]
MDRHASRSPSSWAVTEALRSHVEESCRRIFPRWRPRADLRPRLGKAPDGATRIRWLGAAGHVVETERTTILIDPFLSRPSLWRVATSPLVPDEDAIRAHAPSRIHAVACGHSHYDHLLDAPLIAKNTGALLIGTRTTCAFGEAAGLPPERMLVVPPSGATFFVGDVELTLVPSRHGKLFRTWTPFPGEVTGTPTLPARAWHYRLGGTLGIMLRAGGLTIYHNGSADLIDAAIEGKRADVLLVGLAGRNSTPRYLSRLVHALSPSVVVPTHYDSFFSPLEDGVRLLPGIDLDGFVAEARSITRGARVITPSYGEVLAVPSEDPRGAAIVDPRD